MPCECCGKAIHADGCDVEEALQKGYEAIGKAHEHLTGGASAETFKVLLQVLHYRRTLYNAMVAMYGAGSVGLPGVHEGIKNAFEQTGELLKDRIAKLESFVHEIHLDPSVKTSAKIEGMEISCHFVSSLYHVRFRVQSASINKLATEMPKEVVGRVHYSPQGKVLRLQIYVKEKNGKGELVCIADSPTNIPDEIFPPGIPTTMGVDFGLGESGTVFSQKEAEKAAQQAAEYLDKEIEKMLGVTANDAPPTAHGHFDPLSVEPPENDPSDDMEEDEDPPDPYDDYVPCPHCNGEGQKDGVVCSACSGSGESPPPAPPAADEFVLKPIGTTENVPKDACPECKGVGKLMVLSKGAKVVGQKACPECSGSGKKSALPEEPKVEIEPCDKCDGTGCEDAAGTKCFKCDGTGIVGAHLKADMGASTTAPAADQAAGKISDVINAFKESIEKDAKLKKALEEEAKLMLGSSPVPHVAVSSPGGKLTLTPSGKAKLAETMPVGVLTDIPNVKQVQIEKVPAMAGYETFDITINHVGDLDPVIVSGKLKPFGLTLESWSQQIISNSVSTSKARYRWNPLVVVGSEETPVCDKKWTQFVVDDHVSAGDPVYLKNNGHVTGTNQEGVQFIGTATTTCGLGSMVSVLLEPGMGPVMPQAHLHLEKQGDEIFYVKGEPYVPVKAVAPEGYANGRTYLTLKKVPFSTGISQPLETNMILRAHFQDGCRDYIVEGIGADIASKDGVHRTVWLRPVEIPAEPHKAWESIRTTEAGGVLFLTKKGEAILGIEPDGKIVVNPKSKMFAGKNLIEVGWEIAEEFWKAISGFNPLNKKVSGLEADLMTAGAKLLEFKNAYMKLKAQVDAAKAEREKPPPYERSEAAKIRFENVAKNVKPPEEGRQG